MRARTTSRPWLILVALVLVLGAAACGDDDDSTETGETGGDATTGDTTSDGATEGDGGGDGGEQAGGSSGDCARDQLQLVSDDKLTIGTDSPAFPPWFEDDDPTNGEGFESAVAYEVAQGLGFSDDEVEWTVVPFNRIFAPGEKDFDFAVNQVSISDRRDEAVDFSDGYYDVNQAIVGFEDSDAAGAETVEDLRGLRLGAQEATTSLEFIEEVIQPEQEPFVYNDNNAAKAALDAEQVDGIVLDLPTAFYVSSVEIEGTAVIGQFPSTGDEQEQFGIVFEEGNPLRDCVNEVLAEMEDSGRLDEIEQQWLAEATGAPVIELDQ